MPRFGNFVVTVNPPLTADDLQTVAQSDPVDPNSYPQALLVGLPELRPPIELLTVMAQITNMGSDWV